MSRKNPRKNQMSPLEGQNISCHVLRGRGKTAQVSRQQKVLIEASSANRSGRVPKV